MTEIHFLLTFAAAGAAYLASALAARRNLFSLGTHRVVWNLVLLLSFAGSAGTGILLLFKHVLPDLGGMVRLHDQMGAGLLAAGVGHTIERFTYFANRWKAAWASRDRTHWPQVAAAVVALSALVALPSVVLRIDSGKAADVGGSPRGRRAIPLSRDSSASLPQGPASPVARSTTGSGRVRPGHGRSTGFAREVERVLDGARGPGAGTPTGGVRIENRSTVADDAIEKILRGVQDPELRINVYDLGLVRQILVDSSANISVGLVFTTPTCPNNTWLVDRMRTLLSEASLFRTVEIHTMPGQYWCSDFMTEEGHHILMDMGRW